MENTEQATTKNPRGAGRKPEYPNDGPMVERSVRMPDSFWQHLKDRGGDTYLRKLVGDDRKKSKAGTVDR